ncbi:MAG: hypothetical protein ACLQUY_00915 [Ktedonobacterales bacterium]
MLDTLLETSFRDLRRSLGAIIRAGLTGALLGFILTELFGLILDGSWPARIFVHLAAVAFALLLGYAVSLTTAAIITIRGLRSATRQLEHMTRSAMGTGFHAVDSVVDADTTHQHAG